MSSAGRTFDADKKHGNVAAMTTAIVAGLASSELQAGISDVAPQLASADSEAAGAAKRAMWQAVRRAGRPGAESERKAIEADLISLLEKEQPAAVYREVLWMLSEIGTAAAVPTIAALLSHDTAREDARMSLQRIPGEESLAALKSGLASVPADFRLNIAQSLRARGVDVPGLPCQKLKPVKQTKVAPARE